MSTVDDVLAEASRQIGKPYVFGAEGPDSFDCSGLVQYVYGLFGVRLPRTAQDQQQAVSPVASPQPGDLVFWGNPATHVAIYAGNGMQIAAPQPGEAVKLQKVYGSPTYGRIAGIGTGNALSGALVNAGNSLVGNTFKLDTFFKQVSGVSLQLIVAGMGLSLVGFGIWRVTGPVRQKTKEIV